MIRCALLVFLLSSALLLRGQDRLHLYPDDNLVWRDMLAHVENGLVRLGASWDGDVVFTLQHDALWEETKVFQGFSTSALDVAFTVRENKLYLGDQSFTDAVLYTYHEGQIFAGHSTFAMDVVYTLREETRRFSGAGNAPLWGVYKEDSWSWSDRVGVIEGRPDVPRVLAILSAAGLL